MSEEYDPNASALAASNATGGDQVGCRTGTPPFLEALIAGRNVLVGSVHLYPPRSARDSLSEERGRLMSDRSHRLRAATQAVAVTAPLVVRALGPNVLPTNQPIPVSVEPQAISRCEGQAPGHTPTTDDIVKQAAELSKIQRERERDRAMELGYQLREPDTRDERRR